MLRALPFMLISAFGLLACDDDDADPAPAPDAHVATDAQGGEGGQGGDGGAIEADASVVDARRPDAAADAMPPDAMPPDAALPDAGADMAVGCAPAGVVEFTTDDGIRLVADFAPAGPRAAILLHMIPPGNTRANYPAEFIAALNARGVSVLNVDRRGAGDSDGVAREAYEGPNGWLDAKAARDFLAASGCDVDLTRVTLVGASNGTTTALDYAIEAADDAAPAALVFLTGGGYTENQHRVAEHRPTLDALPLLFVFSTAERQWSAGFAGLTAAPDWRFEEFADGAHGTRMFGAVPASIAIVADWIDAATP